MHKRIKTFSKTLKILLLFLILVELVYLTSYVFGEQSEPNNIGLTLDMPLSYDTYDTSSKTFQDKSGWNHNGYSLNDAIFSADKYGKGQSSMYFNGVNDEVRINNSSYYKTPSITVSFWVKPQNQNKRHVLVTTWRGFTTEINADGIFKWGLSGLSGQYYGNNVIPWNEWSYVTGTFDNDTKQQCIYINGALKQCQAVTGSIYYDPNNLYVYGSWGKAKAEVNSIKIYNHSLSAAEVKDLYNSYRPKIKLPSLDSGLVAYWPLNADNYNATTNRVTDMSAYNNHGVNNGAILTEDRFARSGGAMRFGNTSNKENIVAPIQSISYNLTMCAWIKPNSLPAERATILLGSGAYYLSLYNNGQIQTYWYGRNPSGYHSSASGVVGLNTWSHVCAKWTNDSVSVYINGVQKNTVAINNAPGVSANMLIIGAESSSRQFKGSIAEARVYNRALSDSEIASLFDKDAPKVSFNSANMGLTLDYIFDHNHFEPGRPTSWFIDRQQEYYADEHGTQMPEDYATFSDNAYINIPHNEAINTESLSLVLWVKHQNYTYPRTFGAIKKSSPNCYQDGGVGWDFGHDYKVTGVDVCLNDGTHKVRDTLDFNAGSLPAGFLNAWVQIIYVIDRNSNRVYAYINGVKQTDEVNISAVTGSIKNAANIVLGSLYGWYIDGDVKSLKVYNRAISDKDAQLIYNQDIGRSGIILRSDN